MGSKAVTELHWRALQCDRATVLQQCVKSATYAPRYYMTSYSIWTSNPNSISPSEWLFGQCLCSTWAPSAVWRLCVTGNTLVETKNEIREISANSLADRPDECQDRERANVVPRQLCHLHPSRGILLLLPFLFVCLSVWCQDLTKVI